MTTLIEFITNDDDGKLQSDLCIDYREGELSVYVGERFTGMYYVLKDGELDKLIEALQKAKEMID